MGLAMLAWDSVWGVGFSWIVSFGAIPAVNAKGAHKGT